MVVYLETSALLSIVFREAGYEQLATRVERSEKVVTSSLTILETRRAIVRRPGGLSEANSRELLGLIASLREGWEILKITTEVEERAAALFPVEPIRALDAIHLATALQFRAVYPRLEVVSTDRRILENLVPLGF